MHLASIHGESDQCISIKIPENIFTYYSFLAHEHIAGVDPEIFQMGVEE